MASVDPARASAREPIRFGKYLLLDRISIGGMAEVWRATELEAACRVVALKRLLPSVAEHPELVEMFIAEATLLLQLDHPNIVRAYELGESAHQHFISMEYIRGKDLGKVLNRCRRLGQRLPLPLICQLISKLCEALDFAHRWKEPNGREANLVHRDVSPSNLLLGFGGEVKLIDFGIARAGKRRWRGDPPSGKRAYMSPEQAQSLAIDRRSDIFSVGVCLREMLTADRPGSAQAIPASSPPLEQMVLKALAADPETRYQYAGELAADLQRFLRQSHFEAKDLVTYMQSSFGEEIEQETEATLLAQTSSAPPLPRAVALGPLLSNALAPPGAAAPPAPELEPRRGPEPLGAEDTPDASVSPGVWSPPVRVSDAVRASVRAFAEPLPGGASTAGPAEAAEPETVGRQPSRPGAGESQAAAGGTNLSTASDTAAATPSPSTGRVKAMAFGMAGAAVVLAIVGAVFWLTQEANSGFLSIDIPAGLQGKHLVASFRGEPLQVPDHGKLLHKLKVGPGLLKLEADGHQPFSQTVHVRGVHEVTEVSPKLVPIVKTALLAVVAEPEDAQVRVDGTPVAPSGGSTFYLREVPVGAERLVQVQRAGYKSFESRVTASASGEQMTIRAKLQPFDHWLSVSSSPPGALVWANGARLGRTPLEAHLPSTTTELTVGKRCYRPAQVPLATPGETREAVPLHVSLKRLPGCR